MQFLPPVLDLFVFQFGVSKFDKRKLKTVKTAEKIILPTAEDIKQAKKDETEQRLRKQIGVYIVIVCVAIHNENKCSSSFEKFEFLAYITKVKNNPLLNLYENPFL